MDIIFSANNGEKVLILPVILNSMPQMVQTYNNTTFETLDGELNLIGNKALRTVEIQSVFPVNNKSYKIRPGSDPNGWNYVSFFNEYAWKKMPVRMVWTDKNKEISNMAYTVESFATKINICGDIEYTLNLKEYRFV